MLKFGQSESYGQQPPLLSQGAGCSSPPAGPWGEGTQGACSVGSPRGVQGLVLPGVYPQPGVKNWIGTVPSVWAAEWLLFLVVQNICWGLFDHAYFFWHLLTTSNNKKTRITTEILEAESRKSWWPSNWEVPTCLPNASMPLQSADVIQKRRIYGASLSEKVTGSRCSVLAVLNKRDAWLCFLDTIFYLLGSYLLSPVFSISS